MQSGGGESEKASKGTACTKSPTPDKAWSRRCFWCPMLHPHSPPLFQPQLWWTVPMNSDSPLADSHPLQTSEHLSAFSDKAISAVCKYRSVNHTPNPGTPQLWGTNALASPALGQHLWEAFCILLRRSRQIRALVPRTAVSKMHSYWFFPPSFSLFLCPHSFWISPVSHLSHFKGTQSRIHIH